MQFGRVPEDELENIDFCLPADPAFNSTILKAPAVKNRKIYTGCNMWGLKEWAGKIYPHKTTEKEFLAHYIKSYNSVELNATHYNIYQADVIKKWAGKAAKQDFLFCPKMYKDITHSGSLKEKKLITEEFLKGLLAFEEHLGPIFMQMSEKFSPKRKDELYAYLKTLPTNLQFFVEVRHPDFFADKKIAQELFSTLKDLNIGAVITDTAGRRDCAHMYLTVPKTFIRFVGNSLHASDYTRINAWVKHIKYWLDNGLNELYFFVHMHNEVTSPELTVYLVDELNKKCGLDLKKPVFVAQQKELFE